MIIKQYVCITRIVYQQIVKDQKKYPYNVVILSDMDHTLQGNSYKSIYSNPSGILQHHFIRIV